LTVGVISHKSKLQKEYAEGESLNCKPVNGLAVTVEETREAGCNAGDPSWHVEFSRVCSSKKTLAIFFTVE